MSALANLNLTNNVNLNKLPEEITLCNDLRPILIGCGLRDIPLRVLESGIEMISFYLHNVLHYKTAAAHAEAASSGGAFPSASGHPAACSSNATPSSPGSPSSASSSASLCDPDGGQREKERDSQQKEEEDEDLNDMSAPMELPANQSVTALH